MEEIRWYQWAGLVTSLVSVSKGSLDYIRITMNGNKRKPELAEILKILPFLIHFLTIFLGFVYI